MTGYVNWMAYTQKSKDGAIQTQGNTVADFVTVASAGTSAAAPQGSQYATVYCTVASKIEANIIGCDGQHAGIEIYNAKELFCGANERIEIPNVVPGFTTLTITDV